MGNPSDRRQWDCDYSSLSFIRVSVFLCVYYYYCCVEYYGTIFLRGAYVTIKISRIFISLSRVHVVFLFWSLFPVFPRIQTVACLFYSQSNFIGSYFLYSLGRQTFSDLFYMRFY